MQDTFTFRSLTETFLQGTGVPCPRLFAEINEGFSPLVNLDTIDSPAFRSRIFLWATTGSPSVDPSLEGSISVSHFRVQAVRPILMPVSRFISQRIQTHSMALIRTVL